MKKPVYLVNHVSEENSSTSILNVGLNMPEKSDFIIRITAASANNLSVIVGYDFILIKN